MHRSVFGAVVVAAALAASPSSAQSPFIVDPDRGVLSLAPVVGPISPGVVQIFVEGADDARMAQRPTELPVPPDARVGPQGGPFERRQRGSGSGVVIDADAGLVLTNHHVVEQGASLRVGLIDGRSLDAEVIGSDEATDLALLRIEADGLTVVEIGDSDQLQVGDLVIAIGYPFRLEQTVTLGIVSGLGRTLQRQFTDFIQTDAAINPGNSGGALVDSRGRLIGINTAIYSRSGGNVGIGYAVPMALANVVVDQLLAFGEVRRGRLGVEPQELSPELAEALELPSTDGALIAEVEPGSAGEQAGLEAGDVLIRAGGLRVDGVTDLMNAVGLTRPDRPLKLSVMRSGALVELEAQLEAPAATDGVVFAGARFVTLPDDHPLRGRLDGVGVDLVRPGTATGRTGLRRGDVVTHLDAHAVSGLDDVRDVLQRVGDAAVLTVVRGNAEFELTVDVPR
ncbi:MAG: trypsin-like peptidase domain-containing protein [Pseudomonadota bacterium]